MMFSCSLSLGQPLLLNMKSSDVGSIKKDNLVLSTDKVNRPSLRTLKKLTSRAFVLRQSEWHA